MVMEGCSGEGGYNGEGEGTVVMEGIYMQW